MTEIIKNSIRKITSLCEKLKVEKLWIFGSATNSSFSADSDVDFLVSFENLKPEDYAENYFLLAENLEEILGRDVDLVTVNSLSNPYFIQSVEESKTLIYDRHNQEILI
ncbi:hypothetical protein SAMN05444280_12030 [Tangfeifania diversioriginum]|uniref:Polymerase beta nucleotidyltransferase domain-containing protein n=1 Tax=Tangfeifania diversioriginum TaxID=1168035 RepID=A0A1M6JHT5_9BACT|nr:nucleotidyltransferase domain-containing protein [Tangfeifania diversioriginum]SHJ46236.1 hypothetical protein SAMN05444280_12030 [Tangfeifania diversioriginum]